MKYLEKLATVVALIFCGQSYLHAQYFDTEEIVSNNDSLGLEIAIEPDSSEYRNEADSLELQIDYAKSDSLLLAWYESSRRIRYDDSLEDLDSAKFTSQVPDSVYIRRIKDMNAFFQLPYNEIVRNYIILYSEKMKGGKIERILGMSNHYMPIFEETMDRYDIPEELKVMSIIESSLNPVAVSRVGAKGLWQFMYSTAKLYGLEINSFVDERLDPFKAADAAARYLRDSYMIFGDWNLAIASYNCGPGNVNKAIRRSGGHREFWDIWPFLPRETRGYVPAFVGALYTLNYYKEHGIKPAAIDTPSQLDTFKVHKMLHFKQISDILGVPTEVLKTLNPQYKHEIIPGNEKEYILRLPAKYTNSFIENQDTLYRHRADSLFNPVTIKKIKDGGDGEMIFYKVKSGDYLGRIASRYGCSVNQIKRWNGLKNNNIRVGQRLRLYRGGRAPASSAATGKTASKTNASTGNTKTSATGTKAASNSAKKDTSKWVTAASYTVKQGDSLYSIAKGYPGVSAQDIMDYNKISSSIRPGMVLKIPKIN